MRACLVGQRGRDVGTGEGRKELGLKRLAEQPGTGGVAAALEHAGVAAVGGGAATAAAAAAGRQGREKRVPDRQGSGGESTYTRCWVGERSLVCLCSACSSPEGRLPVGHARLHRLLHHEVALLLAAGAATAAAAATSAAAAAPALTALVGHHGQAQRHGACEGRTMNGACVSWINMIKRAAPARRLPSEASATPAHAPGHCTGSGSSSSSAAHPCRAAPAAA